MSLILAIIILLKIFSTVLTQSNTVGNDFFLGLPLSPAYQLPDFELIIGTPSNHASYVVEGLSGVIISGKTSSNRFSTVILQRSLEVTSGGYAQRMKGIQVRATGENPISVLVVITYPFYGVAGSASLLIHPNKFNANEFEYFAVSTDYAGLVVRDRHSAILLVGNHNETEVIISPRQTVLLPENTQNPTAPMIIVEAGSTHTVSLGRLQTLLLSSLNDLTGTRIVSNKPLTVLSGHQCAQIPSVRAFCEPIYVQVPPTLNWGRVFFLAPFDGRTSNQFYKLVTSKNSTSISYRCPMSNINEVREVMTSGSGELLTFSSRSYCYLTANNPVFVVQLGAGFIADNSGDPAISVVSPTTGYVKSATFTSLPSALNNFISVTVEARYFVESQIHLDGSQLTCTWSNILNTSTDDIVGYGCTARVSAATHTVSHTGKGILSVIVYGWNRSPALGYAYLPGITFPVNIDDDKLPFYDLTRMPGLQELPREKDAYSQPIVIPGSLIFGDEIVSSVYVNENGAFSFQEPLKFSHPNRFPTKYFGTRLKHILAPFWSDNDIRKEGTVRYVTIERSTSPVDNTIMNEATTFVNDRLVVNQGGFFEPTWMLVAQWDGVHPSPHGSESHEGISEEYLNRTNTYQGIIITNTVHSYYIFSLACGDIQWSGLGLETAVLGYNSKGNFFKNHPANGFADVGRIISCTKPIHLSGGGGGKRKKRNANVGAGTAGEMPANNEDQEAIGICISIAYGDLNFSMLVDANNDSVDILEQVPHCPPTKDLADINTEFLPYEAFTMNCYRSRDLFMPNIQVNILLEQEYRFASVCCYNQNGALINAGVNAGRLTDISTREYHFRQNCCVKTDLCEKYLNRRPIIPPGPPDLVMGSSASGDPHYTGFDGKYYTFRAIGEYYIVKAASQGKDIFQLQGRLGKIPAWPGASTTKSLAFGIPGEYSYQYVHDDEPILVKTIGAGEAEQINIPYTDDHVDITRSGRDVKAFIKNVKVNISMTWNSGHHYMNYKVYVPKVLCKIAVGHMGNCDGNKDNDVSTPNQDRILQNESMFCYTNTCTFEGKGKKRRSADTEFQCTSFDDCGDHSFRAIEFVDLNISNRIRDFCDNVLSCQYDLALTGDMEVAGLTKQADVEITRIHQLTSNYPPNITSENGDIFFITVGEENIYSFAVVDTNHFNVTIDGGTPMGGILSDDGKGTYTFRWTPTSSPEKPLSFMAMDTIGAATLHEPVLRVCACFNGGECTMEILKNKTIETLICNCTEAYTGDTCSEDKNGCSDIECFSGVECLDVPAPGVGATCRACPNGFTGNGLRCYDLNECLLNDSKCDQVCTNKFGGYECNCNPGFALNDDTNMCEDIDECRGISGCQHGCTNTVGSFTCTCLDGFTLDVNAKTCTPLTFCAGNPCSHICAIVNGKTRCFCPLGFQLGAGSTTRCEDIDECDRYRPCDMLCSNTEGSYECNCNDGYELHQDGRTCVDIDECRVAALVSLVICPQDKRECNNTIGSFNCVCAPGYELVDDECQRVIEMIPPPQVDSPDIGNQNTITFMSDIDRLTTERLQAFRTVTAIAITRFCRSTKCLLITTDGSRNQTAVIIQPQNVAVPKSIIDDGHPVISFFVQLSSTTFVSKAVIWMAVQEANYLYREARFIGEYDCLCQDGPPGIPGENGLPGLPGENGVPGLPGIHGVPGATGRIGEPGSKGEKGQKGSPGEKGQDGPKGREGPRGFPGDLGLPGPMGYSGPKGSTGEPGPSGPSGPPGARGPIGSPGARGPIGPPGLPGRQGPIGPVGPVGPIGMMGMKGSKGSRGSAYCNCRPGPPGRSGPSGQKGMLGYRGLPGPPGRFCEPRGCNYV